MRGGGTDDTARDAQNFWVVRTLTVRLNHSTPNRVLLAFDLSTIGATSVLRTRGLVTFPVKSVHLTSQHSPRELDALPPAVHLVVTGSSRLVNLTGVLAATDFPVLDVVCGVASHRRLSCGAP